MMRFFHKSNYLLQRYSIRLPKLRFPLQEVERVLSEDQQAYVTKYLKPLLHAKPKVFLIKLYIKKYKS
jgi:hypothetical protein